MKSERQSGVVLRLKSEPPCMASVYEYSDGGNTSTMIGDLDRAPLQSVTESGQETDRVAPVVAGPVTSRRRLLPQRRDAPTKHTGAALAWAVAMKVIKAKASLTGERP